MTNEEFADRNYIEEHRTMGSIKVWVKALAKVGYTSANTVRNPANATVGLAKKRKNSCKGIRTPCKY
jgi:hypothetical protein